MSRIQPQVPLKLQELVGDCGRKIPVRSHRKIANAMAAAFARSAAFKHVVQQMAHRHHLGHRYRPSVDVA